MTQNYSQLPVIAQWLTRGKNDAIGVVSVSTRCHRGDDAYHIYSQKTTKVIGAEPRSEWVFKVSIDQSKWDKALASLALHPEAKPEFFQTP